MKKLALQPVEADEDRSNSSKVADQPLITRFEHLVQFYESDDFLADRVNEFIAEGLEAGEGAIVIGTPAHRQAVEKRLSHHGFNLASLKASQQYFSLDAGEILSRLIVNGSPDETLFHREIGGLVSKAGNGGRRSVRAFGEMVALLWADGNSPAALRLEELWNELSETHAFSLLCAYPLNGFSGTVNDEAFGNVCHAHSDVLPTENSLNSAQNEEHRRRTAAVLQQKAKTLESENDTDNQIEDRSRLLAAIVESSDDAIVSKDLNGIITSWNKGAERVFGYQAHEMIGHSVLELIPPDRQHEEPGILAQLRNGFRIDHYETVRLRKDGSLVEVSLTVSPIKDHTGKTVGASKIARDITERKRSEQQQQILYELTTAINRAVALPEIYETAIEAICRSQNAPRAAILLYDAEGTMRFKAWRNLSDEYRRVAEGHSPWKRDDSTAQPVCINDVLLSSLTDHLKTVIEREGIRSLVFLPISYEGRLLGKFMVYYNKPHNFVLAELMPAQTIVNQVAFAIERRRAGENLERMVNERTASLREAIAQMEEFSYSVSHDLRAPVRAMQCYAEVLMEDYGSQLDDHGKKYLERIIQGGTRMDRLIQDILTYSRMSRREIQLHPISLDKLTREIVRQYLDLGSAAQAEVFVEGKLLDVVGHEPSLSQAISNLLNNAVKFVNPGAKPKVRISTERRNGDIRLWIDDNGIGIKPEYQHRLFSVFERVHPEKNYEGTGIGLAIVRKAAERMGGKVGVESDGVNGSKFWIQLPAAETT